MSQLSMMSAALSEGLFAAVWQGALLVGLVALALRLLPAVPAAVRSGIWTVVFSILLAMHFVSTRAGGAGASAHALHVLPGWSVAVAAVWLVLSSVRAAQLVASGLRLREIRRRAVPVALDPALPVCGGRACAVCSSPDVDRPSVLGFFSPQVLLPEGLMEALTLDELRQVLLHETEHLRRSDDWVNLLQKLALVVFPLNPVLFWVERRLCLERELACDDRVLAVSAEATRKGYATCLTRIAEHGILRRGLTLALGAFGQRSELATRVHRLLRRPERTMSRGPAGFAAAALLLAATAGSVELARAPRLISFAPAPSEMAANTNFAAPSLARETWARQSAMGGHAVLARAVVPVAPPAVKARPHARRAIARRPVQTPRVLRTELRSQAPTPELAQPRYVLTIASATQVQSLFQPAIAVVRTADGWLVIQL